MAFSAPLRELHDLLALQGVGQAPLGDVVPLELVGVPVGPAWPIDRMAAGVVLVAGQADLGRVSPGRDVR